MLKAKPPKSKKDAEELLKKTLQLPEQKFVALFEASLQGPLTHIGKGPQTVDAGVVPEVYQDHLPPQCENRKRIRVEPEIPVQLMCPDGIRLQIPDCHRTRRAPRLVK